MSEAHIPFRGFWCGIFYPHDFAMEQQVCLGATLHWIMIVMRHFRDTKRCKICGKTQTSDGLRYQQSHDDLCGPKDGWDDELWPLDKHGERLPSSSDVLAGLKPMPECSSIWIKQGDVLETGAKYRPHVEMVEVWRAKHPSAAKSVEKAAELMVDRICRR